MNWYKRSQVIDRELGNRYLPDEEEYAYMSGRDDQYLNKLRRKRNDELWWKDEEKRNARHHKKNERYYTVRGRA